MQFLSPNRAHRFARNGARNQHGSVIPLVAFSTIFMVGFFGVVFDLMRDFQCVNELQFAGKAAGLYGMSFATDNNGNYSLASAQSNISSAIATANNSIWNFAQAGPSTNNPSWSEPVTVQANDIQFIPNPNGADATNFLLQVTTRRQSQNAVTQFFLPVLLLTRSPLGQQINPQAYSFSTSWIAEIIGQPASRIGAGPSANSSSNSSARVNDFLGFATFPIAISNQQFAALASPTNTASQFQVDLVSSTSSEYTGPPPNGNVKGALVNVTANSYGTNYYGSGQGTSAINQLEATLGYFGAKTTQQVIPPTVVERGSMLSGFDPADSSFKNRQSEIGSTLSSLPVRRNYIVPVITADPNFSATNQVAGFAYLQLLSVATSGSGAPTSVTFGISQQNSVPVRNATVATGYSSISGNALQSMPPAVYPFLPLQWDYASNGISTRPRGVVMAPAMSPRIVNRS